MSAFVRTTLALLVALARGRVLALRAPVVADTTAALRSIVEAKARRDQNPQSLANTTRERLRRFVETAPANLTACHATPIVELEKAATEARAARLQLNQSQVQLQTALKEFEVGQQKEAALKKRHGDAKALADQRRIAVANEARRLNEVTDSLASAETRLLDEQREVQQLTDTVEVHRATVRKKQDTLGEQSKDIEQKQRAYDDMSNSIEGLNVWKVYTDGNELEEKRAEKAKEEEEVVASRRNLENHEQKLAAKGAHVRRVSDIFQDVQSHKIKLEQALQSEQQLLQREESALRRLEAALQEQIASNKLSAQTVRQAMASLEKNKMVVIAKQDAALSKYKIAIATRDQDIDGIRRALGLERTAMEDIQEAVKLSKDELDACNTQSVEEAFQRGLKEFALRLRNSKSPAPPDQTGSPAPSPAGSGDGAAAKLGKLARAIAAARSR